MITVTDNYFADLNSAIEAGVFSASDRRPKKADLYAAIATYNAALPAVEADGVESDAPEGGEAIEPGWVEIDRFDLPADAYRCDRDPGFMDWFVNAGKNPLHRVEGNVHAGYVVYALQSAAPAALSQVGDEPVTQEAPLDIAALEAAGDEDAICAALLAMDEAEAAKPARAAAKPRKDPAEILEGLEPIVGDCGEKGIPTIARLLGTSPARLTKRIKAYELIMSDDRIHQAFLSGQLSYSFLQEMAVRRDGRSQIEAKLIQAA